MFEADFVYESTNTIIQCNDNEKMNAIIERFAKKVGINELNKVYFLFLGEIIDKNLTLKEIISRKDGIELNKIKIYVKNINESWLYNSKDIICPKCGEKACITINNYKVKIFGCKNGHQINDILLNEFERTQNGNNINIFCNNCNINSNLKGSNHNFFWCRECKQNLCEICKLNHDKKHNIHDNEYKNYICNIHNDFYCIYCKDCEKNLCLSCEPEHKNHITISLLHDSEKLVNDLDNFRYNMDIFTDNINNLIRKLKRIIENIEVYYRIYNKLVKNYKNQKRNFELIQNLKEISNNSILKDICLINNENDINSKINGYLEMYKKMIINEISLKFNINKNNKVKIFGQKFVDNNKDKCKIIFENKEYGLQTEFDIKDINKDILEIKLKGIGEIENISWMFSHCNSLSSLSDISKWDTTNIIDMSYLFANCNTLEYLPDISNWNTSNVKYMQGVFRNCQALKEIPDISKWNTSNIIYLGGCFSKDNSSALSSLEIENYIKTNKKYIIGGMFLECNSLKYLPDISRWNTSKVINMGFMFDKCNSLSSLPDISKWDISNVQDLNCVFGDCYSLKSLPDISKWNISNVNIVSSLFYNCKTLKTLPDISKWNFSKVIDMHDIFNKCSSLISLPDISKWDISNVKDMSALFGLCSSLSSIPNISKWNTDSAIDMSLMFAQCGNLKSLPNISKWNTEKVKNMSSMFGCCSKLSSLPDISTWNVSNVNDLSFMFGGCESLSSLPDISKWNVREDAKIESMFELCKDDLNIPNKFKK